MKTKKEEHSRKRLMYEYHSYERKWWYDFQKIEKMRLCNNEKCADEWCNRQLSALESIDVNGCVDMKNMLLQCKTFKMCSRVCKYYCTIGYCTITFICCRKMTLLCRKKEYAKKIGGPFLLHDTFTERSVDAFYG